MSSSCFVSNDSGTTIEFFGVNLLFLGMKALGLGAASLLLVDGVLDSADQESWP